MHFSDIQQKNADLLSKYGVKFAPYDNMLPLHSNLTAFSLSFLLSFFACHSSKQIKPAAITIQSFELQTLSDGNYKMDFYVQIKQQSHTSHFAEAMGVEVFAKGLKIGENYCLLNRDIPSQQKALFPVSIVFNKQDMGLSKSQVIENLNINIIGQLRFQHNNQTSTLQFEQQIETRVPAN